MLDTQKEREKKRRSTSEIKTAGSFFTSRDGGFDIIVVVRAAKKRVRATSDDGPQRTKREEAKISTPPKTLFLSRDDRVGDDVFHEDGREGFLRNENHRKKNTLFVLPRERVFTNLAREEREREREGEQKPTDGHGIPARSTHSSPEKRA